MKVITIKGMIIILSASLWFANHAYPQPNLPRENLNSDIEIMEIVLDKLILPERGNLPFFGSNTKGYYLANYGVIFDVNYSFLNRNFITLGIDQRINIKEKYLSVIEADNDEKQISEAFEKDIERLKQGIVKFLSSWTMALSDLPPDEKVTVMVDFNGFFPALNDAMDFSTQKLLASTSIRDIANVRKGSMSQSEFANMVEFDENKSQDEDISIFSKVIQTSLEHSDQRMDLGLSGNVKGIYFNGYGVIFFTDVSFGSNLFTIYSDAFRKGREQSFSISVPASDIEVRNSKNLERIEQKLVQVISKYGYNLKSLKPDEWVEIAVNYKSIPVKENYSKGILRVQKKFIDDYNRDRIKFDQFRKMVKVAYY